jgi:prefoldin subunit 5
MSDLLTRAKEIKNATEIGENTAERVGGVMVDMVMSIMSAEESLTAQDAQINELKERNNAEIPTFTGVVDSAEYVFDQSATQFLGVYYIKSRKVFAALNGDIYYTSWQAQGMFQSSNCYNQNGVAVENRIYYLKDMFDTENALSLVFLKSGSFVEVSDNAEIEDLQTRVTTIEENAVTIVNDLTTGGADKALSAEMGKELNVKLSTIIGGEALIKTIHTTLHSGWNKYLFVIPFDGENVGYGISTKVYCKDIPDGTYDKILAGYVGSYTNPIRTTPVTFKDGYAILDGSLLTTSKATGWRLGTAGADINLTSDSTLEIIKNYDSKLDEIDGRISEISNQISEVNKEIGLIEEDIENLSDKIELVNSIDDDINGKIELSLVGTYDTIKHVNWGTYAFLIPFTDVIQKDVDLTIYCKDIPNGTYPNFVRGYKDNDYTKVTGYLELTFKGGYAILDGTSITNESTSGWIIGTAAASSPITQNSTLEVYVSKKVSNGLKDEISELKDNADFYQEKGADYYQKLWSTMNCTPYMLKEYSWYNQFEWNLNIGFNTDSHDESPEIFSRINRWYKCYEGRNKQSNNAIYCMWSLGDTLSAVPDTKPKAITRWEKVYQSLDDIGSTQRPQLFTIGNHDINQDGTDVSQYFTREDKYNYIIKPMLTRYSSNHMTLDSEGTFSSWNKLPIVTPNVDYPTMWRLDADKEKLRIISLDCYDWEDNELSEQVRSFKCGYFSARQIDFLIDCLNSVPQGYSVVVGSHHAYTGPANGGYKSGQLVRSILTAYRNKTTFTGNLLKVDDATYVKTYNVDFTSSNGRLFRVIGHDHIFSSRNEGDSSVGNLTYPGFTMISANAMGALYRGIYIDQFDMLCYNDTEGIRFVRYGGVGSQKDCKNNDGGDEKGFHFINSPIKV